MIDRTAKNPKNHKGGPHNYLKLTKRTLAPPLLTERQTLAERVVRWILPWTVRNYPGVRRGMVQLLGNHVTYSAIKGWRTGRRHMSSCYAAYLARCIRSRAEQGLRLAEELERLAQHREREEAERREAKRRQFSAVRWQGR